MGAIKQKLHPNCKDPQEGTRIARILKSPIALIEFSNSIYCFGLMCFKVRSNEYKMHCRPLDVFFTCFFWNFEVVIWIKLEPSIEQSRQKTRSFGDSLNKFLKLGGGCPPLWPIIKHHQFMQFIFVTSEHQQLTLFFRCNLYFLLHTRLIEFFLTSQIYQVYFCYYRASPKWSIITSNTPCGNLEQYDTIRHRKNSMRQYVTESMILYVTAKSRMILYITS